MQLLNQPTAITIEGLGADEELRSTKLTILGRNAAIGLAMSVAFIAFGLELISTGF